MRAYFFLLPSATFAATGGPGDAQRAPWVRNLEPGSPPEAPGSPQMVPAAQGDQQRMAASSTGVQVAPTVGLQRSDPQRQLPQTGAANGTATLQLRAEARQRLSLGPQLGARVRRRASSSPTMTFRHAGTEADAEAVETTGSLAARLLGSLREAWGFHFFLVCLVAHAVMLLLVTFAVNPAGSCRPLKRSKGHLFGMACRTERLPP